jgi:hypothetical protein
MTRLLDADPRLRKLCLIKTGEAAYPRRFLVVHPKESEKKTEPE